MRSVFLRRALLTAAALFAIIFVSAALFDEPEPVIQEPPAEVPVTRQVDAAPETVPPLYSLGVWQGRVTVFDGTTGEPLQVTEMPVSSLPDPDQLSLEQGIPVYTEEDLAHLLEDYGS